MTTKTKIQLATGLALAIFSLSLSLPALAIEYGGIGGRPAYPRGDNPRSQSIFIHNNVQTGSVVNEGIKVLNNTAETKSMVVYATDSVVASGGNFACAQKADGNKNVGNWIKLAKDEVMLASMSNEVIPFAINIPATADVGEHSGCIVIQEKSPSADVKAGISGVSLSFRTGIRVSLTVPGDLKKELKIKDFSVKKNENSSVGGYVLTPTIQNLGNTAVDADTKVSPRYFFGRALRDASGKILTFGGASPVLRGQDASRNYELTRDHLFWGGWYRVGLTVDYNADPNVDENSSQDVVLTHLAGPTLTIFAFPQPVALIIEIVVLLIILLLLYLFIIKWKRKNWIKNNWIEHKVKSGDSVEHLVEHYHVAWKLFVKTNHLRPPYTLKVGEVVKVPPAPEGKAKKVKK